MIRPPYLEAGDTVGIVAPASCMKEEELLQGLEVIRSWGLNIVTGKNLYRKINSFAGNDLQRTSDFQEMLDDHGIKAIICARGGYGTVRIIEKLDFKSFLKSPKWIAGCSDVTVLHSVLQHKVMSESLHSAMPRGMTTSEDDAVTFQSLKDALFGKLKGYDIETNPLNKVGVAGGTLTGGNLSVLYSLRGTDYDIDTDGKILFLEDVGEYLYHIDRMLMNMHLARKFERLNGLIIGGMNKMKVSSSGFRKPAYRIINEITKDYDYPVIFGMPSGHIQPNKTLIFGRNVEMSVSEKRVKVVFQ